MARFQMTWLNFHLKKKQSDLFSWPFCVVCNHQPILSFSAGRRLSYLRWTNSKIAVDNERAHPSQSVGWWFATYRCFSWENASPVLIINSWNSKIRGNPNRKRASQRRFNQRCARPFVTHSNRRETWFSLFITWYSFYWTRPNLKEKCIRYLE